ncbi:MAG: cupin domain-containing protein [Acidimicrobiales bacterium]
MVLESRSEAPAIEQTGSRKLPFVLRCVTDVRVGDRTHTLHKGDAIYFDVFESHFVANPRWEPAETLCVVSLQMDAP